MPLILFLAIFDFWFANAGEGKTRSLVAQKLVLETEHPYAHNADRKELVKVNGARKLIVSFDERTR